MTENTGLSPSAAEGGQSHFRGEDARYFDAMSTAPRKLGQSPVNGQTDASAQLGSPGLLRSLLPARLDLRRAQPPYQGGRIVGLRVCTRPACAHQLFIEHALTHKHVRQKDAIAVDAASVQRRRTLPPATKSRVNP